MLTSGPQPAKILILGDFPDTYEAHRKQPFTGHAGKELERMFADAGASIAFARRITLTASAPPASSWIGHNKTSPDPSWVAYRGKWLAPQLAAALISLETEIAATAPELIIACGDLALFFLTGKWGIHDWRGSQMRPESGPAAGIKTVPIVHPSAILRQPELRYPAVHDLRRALSWLRSDAPPPDYRFTIRPTLDETLATLSTLHTRAAAEPLPLAVDIETRAGHIACLGIAWSTLDALCIPFMCSESPAGYWTLDDEAQILLSLSRLLTHPNVQCIGQNFIYDVQYIYRHFHFLPNFGGDTMVEHHVLFPGTPKGLDVLSSLYTNFHLFWKAEGKDWHKTMQEDILWRYNCKDCVITYECHFALMAALRQQNLLNPLHQQYRVWHAALRAMIRGLRVDFPTRAKMRAELLAAQTTIQDSLNFLLQSPLNIRSPKQLQNLFYSLFRIPPIKSRKTGRITTDSEALSRIARKEPLLAPIVERISALRSISVFLSTFIEAQPDPYDSRMRCSFNVAGPETFRLSSSQDAFGYGMNLQNLSSGDE